MPQSKPWLKRAPGQRPLRRDAPKPSVSPETVAKVETLSKEMKGLTTEEYEKKYQEVSPELQQYFKSPSEVKTEFETAMQEQRQETIKKAQPELQKAEQELNKARAKIEYAYKSYEHRLKWGKERKKKWGSKWYKEFRDDLRDKRTKIEDKADLEVRYWREYRDKL